MVIEATGLLLVAAAPGAGWALTGAILAGLGYSLVYPGWGSKPSDVHLPVARRW